MHPPGSRWLILISLLVDHPQIGDPSVCPVSHHHLHHRHDRNIPPLDPARPRSPTFPSASCRLGPCWLFLTRAVFGSRGSRLGWELVSISFGYCTLSGSDASAMCQTEQTNYTNIEPQASATTSCLADQNYKTHSSSQRHGNPEPPAETPSSLSTKPLSVLSHGGL